MTGRPLRKGDRILRCPGLGNWGTAYPHQDPHLAARSYRRDYSSFFFPITCQFIQSTFLMQVSMLLADEVREEGTWRREGEKVVARHDRQAATTGLSRLVAIEICADFIN